MPESSETNPYPFGKPAFSLNMRIDSSTWAPVYTPPWGTVNNGGIVKLSDAFDSSAADLSAVSGYTAATPYAVKQVKDSSLDKFTTDPQTVKGPITFDSGITLPSGTILNGVAASAQVAASLAVSGTIGDVNQFVYFNDGVPVATTSTIGSSTKGIYLTGGKILPMDKVLEQDVTASAKLTDTIPAYTLSLSGDNIVLLNDCSKHITSVPA